MIFEKENEKISVIIENTRLPECMVNRYSTSILEAEPVKLHGESQFNKHS